MFEVTCPTSSEYEVICSFSPQYTEGDASFSVYVEASDESAAVEEAKLLIMPEQRVQQVFLCQDDISF